MKPDYILDRIREPDHNKDEDAWEQLVCECGNKTFENFYTHAYETSARCTACGWMDTIHTG
jgi:hypothetical protein